MPDTQSISDSVGVLNLEISNARGKEETEQVVRFRLHVAELDGAAGEEEAARDVWGHLGSGDRDGL